MKQQITGKTHLKNDIILVVALLLIAAGGMIYLFVFRESGNVVKVTVGGELYGTYSLSRDTVEDIVSGKDGSQLNRLIIRDGKAYVETATCPDGICVNHRPIFRNGESIVCLPNEVVVTVFIEEDDESPDIVA